MYVSVSWSHVCKYSIFHTMCLVYIDLLYARDFNEYSIIFVNLLKSNSSALHTHIHTHIHTDKDMHEHLLSLLEIVLIISMLLVKSV